MRQCDVDGCVGKHKGHGLCQKHLQEKKRRDAGIRLNVRGSCSHPGCDMPHKAKGFCEKHYERFTRHGDASTMKRRANGEGSYIPGSGVTVNLAAEGGPKYLHILMVEKVLGHKLPEGAVVHHVNGDNADNRNDNFVVCPDQAYHLLLHQRMRALESCGNADWLKCLYCKQYDAPENIKRSGRAKWHRACMNEYQKNRQRIRRQVAG